VTASPLLSGKATIRSAITKRRTEKGKIKNKKRMVEEKQM